MDPIKTLRHSVSIVLFTRYPDPGKVKTRLAWDVGDRTAAEIHRTLMSQMLKQLLCEIKGVNIIVNYTGIDFDTDMIRSFDPAVQSDIEEAIKTGILYFIEQPSVSFGERINAIAKQLGKVIIIGSDIPGITPSILSEAIQCVNREEAAIAFTKDEGYYLIALPYYSDVFTTINYTLGKVGQQTYTLMEKNYASTSMLDHSLIDVDEIRDLQSLNLLNLVEQNQVEISVIIPTLNEGDSIYHTLVHLIKQANVSNNIEILIVDGGSEDNTLQRVEDFKKDYPQVLLQCLIISSLGRAFQMNTGLRHSSGKYLVFCHADTLLPSEWDKKIVSTLANKNVKLAYFDLQFNDEHLGLKIVAWTANHIRRSPYGDQAFCVKRDDFKEIGGFDYLSLLEDVAIIDNKIGYHNCKKIPSSIITNARKYSNKNGQYTYLSIFKNVGKNWGIMAGKKLLNLPACELRKIHYGSSLNHQVLEVPFQDKLYTFKYHYPNSLFHKLLIWKRLHYQQYMNQLIPKIVDHCQGNDIFIDVGANVGVVSCLVSMVLAKRRIKTDIIAFETNPYIYQLFKDNYSLYSGEMRNKIYLEKIALQEKLDHNELCTNKKISIIKMNLEKNTIDVLKEMIRLIKQYQPVLFLETVRDFMPDFFDYQSNNKHEEKTIMNLLNSLNYRVEKFMNINYIAYPQNNH